MLIVKIVPSEERTNPEKPERAKAQEHPDNQGDRWLDEFKTNQNDAILVPENVQ